MKRIVSKSATGLSFLKFLGVGLLLSIVVYGITLFTTTEPKTTTILVFAASSLKPVLTEITPLYTQANPTVTVNYRFGGSGSLSQQLLQGAQSDVFIGAATEHLTALNNDNLLISGTEASIAANRLALVVPTINHFNDLTDPPISDFIDLAKDEVQRVTIGNPRLVAAGKYAQEVLEKSGVWRQVEPKIALAQDARAILEAVETGDTDAGLMYLTDAQTSDLVEVVKVSPLDLHSPIIYPAAVLKSSGQPKIARDYVEFLQSKPAQKILEKYGFQMPN